MTAAGSSKKKAVSSDGGKSGTVVVKRTILATIDELFDAWLDPESLAQWMHPGLTMRSTARVDARVNGTFEVVMHHPSGPLRPAPLRCLPRD